MKFRLFFETSMIYIYVVPVKLYILNIVYFTEGDGA